MLESTKRRNIEAPRRRAGVSKSADDKNDAILAGGANCTECLAHRSHLRSFVLLVISRDLQHVRLRAALTSFAFGHCRDLPQEDIAGKRDDRRGAPAGPRRVVHRRRSRS